MAETSSEASSAAGIDLSQFYQVFFEEAGENLDQMEQLLPQLKDSLEKTRAALPPKN